MQPYIVRQGDYLTRLAAERGSDAETVWNNPRNNPLREQRQHYNMLAPGDVVYLPRPEPRPQSVSQGGSHAFTARVPKVSIELVLEDENGAVAGEAYRVEGLSQPIEGQSDGQGAVKLDLPAHVREVQLVVPGRGWRLPVRVGGLDPPDEVSGLRQRLEHLGYGGWYGEGPSAAASGAERLRSSLERFQRDHDLEVTGELDDTTRQRILDEHGG